MTALSFEIKKRDQGSLARLGSLELRGRTLETPLLWLGHSLKDNVSPFTRGQASCPQLLVNACEILSRPGNHQGVLEKGIHGYLDYPGTVLMDSGGFLFQNRDMQACPRQLAEFYRFARADLVVSLDKPLRPCDNASMHRRHWKRTMDNLAIMIEQTASGAIMPVIHGYTLSALRRACRDVRSIVAEPAIVGLGSLVPLIKAVHLGEGFRYRRATGEIGNHVSYITDAIKLVRDEFPEALLHVFGVGGLTTMLIIYAAGADSLDSTTWRIKAAFGAIQIPGVGDRYLDGKTETSRSRPAMSAADVYKLADCKCASCIQASRGATRQKTLARCSRARCIHNSWVLTQEVVNFQKAVKAHQVAELLKSRITNKHRLYPALSTILCG